MAKYIKLEDLMKFPIRLDHYDKEHGDVNFVYGVETVLEYAEYLPVTESDITAQEWVSVNDRLPQKDGAYLVTTNSFGDRQRVKLRWFAKDGENVDAHDLAGQKDVWYLYDIECGYVSIKTVTHWMPLPEPPKGGK